MVYIKEILNRFLFFKYIKSLKYVNIGIAPLKSGADLVTEPLRKGEIMLEE